MLPHEGIIKEYSTISGRSIFDAMRLKSDFYTTKICHHCYKKFSSYETVFVANIVLSRFATNFPAKLYDCSYFNFVVMCSNVATNYSQVEMVAI